jgi:DNA-binding MarR family transcriptional regulator
MTTPVSTFEAFMTLFGTAQQRLKTHMQDEAEQGLGPLHLRALCLCQRDPGCTQQQLVLSMGRDKGQIARLIRELEDRQLLLRTPDDSDRRVWRLSVTAQGQVKCQWFLAIEAAVATDLFGAMAEAQRAQLEELLCGLQARLQGPGHIG